MLSVFHPKIKWSGLKLFVTHVIKYIAVTFCQCWLGFVFLYMRWTFALRVYHATSSLPPLSWKNRGLFCLKNSLEHQGFSCIAILEKLPWHTEVSRVLEQHARSMLHFIYDLSNLHLLHLTLDSLLIYSVAVFSNINFAFLHHSNLKWWNDGLRDVPSLMVFFNLFVVRRNFTKCVCVCFAGG